jgi:hypothetical protein
MTLNFEIPETERETLKDGEYLAVLKTMVEEIDKHGTYVKIGEEIDGGTIRYDRFYIGSYDPEKKKRAIIQFGIFCKQLSGRKTGEKITDQELLNKKYILTIKNNFCEKTDRIYENVTKRVLVEAPQLDTISQNSPTTVQYGGISIPQEQTVSNQPLNDEVPF